MDALDSERPAGNNPPFFPATPRILPRNEGGARGSKLVSLVAHRTSMESWRNTEMITSDKTPRVRLPLRVFGPRAVSALIQFVSSFVAPGRTSSPDRRNRRRNIGTTDERNNTPAQDTCLRVLRKWQQPFPSSCSVRTALFRLGRDEENTLRAPLAQQ